jgi:hypothetical protein
MLDIVNEDAVDHISTQPSGAEFVVDGVEDEAGLDVAVWELADDHVVDVADLSVAFGFLKLFREPFGSFGVLSLDNGSVGMDRDSECFSGSGVAFVVAFVSASFAGWRRRAGFVTMTAEEEREPELGLEQPAWSADDNDVTCGEGVVAKDGIERRQTKVDRLIAAE